MVRRTAPAHDVDMHTTLELSDRDLALAASAHELQRAAGAVQTQAANPDAVPTHELTLAHVEEAVDRLAVAMEQMANAVADWCGEPSAIVEENALPPEARALRWHLQSVADELRAAEIACASSRDWTRRLLLNPPQPDDASMRRGWRLADVHLHGRRHGRPAARARRWSHAAACHRRRRPAP